ncbi:hypothetical protein AAMO2058_001338300 [Amorphochlora amoebiformis]
MADGHTDNPSNKNAKMEDGSISGAVGKEIAGMLESETKEKRGPDASRLHAIRENAQNQLNHLLGLFRDYPTILGDIIQKAKAEFSQITTTVCTPDLMRGKISPTTPKTEKKNFLSIDRVDIAYVYSNPIVCENMKAEEEKNQNLVPFMCSTLSYTGEALAIRAQITRENRGLSMVATVGTFENLQKLLIEHDPRILHINCHGRYVCVASASSQEDEFCLCFEKDFGVLDLFSRARIKDMIMGHRLQLVVVSACNSREAGQVFLDAGVPNVVAVHSDSKILDDACTIFAEKLYFALSHGKSVAVAVETAKNFVKNKASHPVKNESVSVSSIDSKPQRKNTSALTLHTCCCSHDHRSNCPFNALLKQEDANTHGNTHYKYCVPNPVLCKCSTANKAGGGGDGVLHLDGCKWVELWAARLFPTRKTDGRTLVVSGPRLRRDANLIEIDAENWIRAQLALTNSEHKLKVEYFRSEVSERKRDDSDHYSYDAETISSNQRRHRGARENRALEAYMTVEFPFVALARDVLKRHRYDEQNDVDGLIVSRMRACCCAPHLPHNESSKFVLLSNDKKPSSDQAIFPNFSHINSNENSKSTKPALGQFRLEKSETATVTLQSRLLPTYNLVKMLHRMLNEVQSSIGELSRICAVLGPRGVGKSRFCRYAVQYLLERAGPSLHRTAEVDLSKVMTEYKISSEYNISSEFKTSPRPKTSNGSSLGVSSAKSKEQKAFTDCIIRSIGSGLAPVAPPKTISELSSLRSMSYLVLLLNADDLINHKSSLLVNTLASIVEVNPKASFLLTISDQGSLERVTGLRNVHIFELKRLDPNSMRELAETSHYSNHVHRESMLFALNDRKIIEQLDGRPARFYRVKGIAKVLIENDGKASPQHILSKLSSLKKKRIKPTNKREQHSGTTAGHRKLSNSTDPVTLVSKLPLTPPIGPRSAPRISIGSESLHGRPSSPFTPKSIASDHQPILPSPSLRRNDSDESGDIVTPDDHDIFQTSEELVVRVLIENNPWHLNFLALLSYFHRGGLLSLDLDVLWPDFPPLGFPQTPASRYSAAESKAVRLAAYPNNRPHWRVLCSGLEGVNSERYLDDPYARLVQVSSPFENYRGGDEKLPKKLQIKAQLASFIQSQVIDRYATKTTPEMLWDNIIRHLAQVGVSLINILRAEEAKHLAIFYESKSETKLPSPSEPRGIQGWYGNGFRGGGPEGGYGATFDVQEADKNHARGVLEIHRDNFIVACSLPPEYSSYCGHLLVQLAVLEGFRNPNFALEALYRVPSSDVRERAMLYIINGNLILDSMISDNRASSATPRSPDKFHASISSAVEYFNTARSIIEHCPNPTMSRRAKDIVLAYLSIRIGISFERMKEFKTAKFHLRRALKMLMAVKENNPMVKRLSNANFDGAYIQKCLSSTLLRQVVYSIASTKKDLGRVTLSDASVQLQPPVRMGSGEEVPPVILSTKILTLIREAIKHLVQSLAEFETLNCIREQCECQEHLAQAYAKLSRYPEARKSIKKALLLAKALNDYVLQIKLDRIRVWIGLQHSRNSRQGRLLLFLYASPLPTSSKADNHHEHPFRLCSMEYQTLHKAARLAISSMTFLESKANRSIKICQSIATRREFKKAASNGCNILHLSCLASKSGLHLEMKLKPLFSQDISQFSTPLTTSLSTPNLSTRASPPKNKEKDFGGSSDIVSVSDLLKLLRKHWRIGFPIVVISVSGRLWLDKSLRDMQRQCEAEFRSPTFFITIQDSQDENTRSIDYLGRKLRMERKSFLEKFYESYLSGVNVRTAFEVAKDAINQRFIDVSFTAAADLVEEDNLSDLSMDRSLSDPPKKLRYLKTSFPRGQSDREPLTLPRKGGRKATRIVDHSPTLSGGPGIVEDVSICLCYVDGLPDRLPQRVRCSLIGRYLIMSRAVACLLRDRAVFLRGTEKGVGISSVAHACLHFLRARHLYPDGIIVVDARKVRRVIDLGDAVSKKLGRMLGNTPPSTWSVIKSLRAFKMLLLFEHVEGLLSTESADLQTLVRRLQGATSSLSVMVTSSVATFQDVKMEEKSTTAIKVLEVRPLSRIDSAKLMLDRCTRDIKSNEIQHYLSSSAYTTLQEKSGGDCIEMLSRHPLIGALGGNPSKILTAAEIAVRVRLMNWERILAFVNKRGRWKAGKTIRDTHGVWELVRPKSDMRFHNSNSRSPSAIVTPVRKNPLSASDEENSPDSTRIRKTQSAQSVRSRRLAQEKETRKAQTLPRFLDNSEKDERRGDFLSKKLRERKQKVRKQKRLMSSTLPGRFQRGDSEPLIQLSEKRPMAKSQGLSESRLQAWLIAKITEIQDSIEAATEGDDREELQREQKKLLHKLERENEKLVNSKKSSGKKSKGSSKKTWTELDRDYYQ